MKKLITGAILAVLLTAASFAQAGYATVGGQVALPLAFTTQKYTMETYGFDSSTLSVTTETVDVKTKTTATNIGFGVNGKYMFTDLIGIYGSVDIDFLLSTSSKTNDGDKVKSKRKDLYDSQWALDTIVGPAFRLVNTDSLFVYAGPVLHLYYETTKSEVSFLGYSVTTKTKGGMFGAGGTVGLDFAVADHVVIQGGLDAVLDFARFGDTKTLWDLMDAKGTTIIVTPRIGAAYKF